MTPTAPAPTDADYALAAMATRAALTWRHAQERALAGGRADLAADFAALYRRCRARAATLHRSIETLT